MKSLQFPSFWTRQQKNDPDDANSLIFNMKLLFWSDGSRDYCRTCGITDSSRRCSVLGCRLLTGTAEEMDFTVEEKCVWLILSVSLPTTHTHTYTHTRACHENMNTHECNLCTCSWSRRHKTTTHAPWCTKDILANLSHTHTHTHGGSYCICQHHFSWISKSDHAAPQLIFPPVLLMTWRQRFTYWYFLTFWCNLLLRRLLCWGRVP